MEVYSVLTREDAQTHVRSIAFENDSAAAPVRIQKLCLQCHSLANSMGWWVNPSTGEAIWRNFGEMIALIHSELSEALEGARKNLPSDHIEGFSMVEEELADALIRIFDLAGAMDLNLGEAFQRKMEYNQHREDHKLHNRSQEGGKKF